MSDQEYSELNTNLIEQAFSLHMKAIAKMEEKKIDAVGIAQCNDAARLLAEMASALALVRIANSLEKREKESEAVK